MAKGKANGSVCARCSELEAANVDLAWKFERATALLRVAVWRLGGRMPVDVADCRRLNAAKVEEVPGAPGQYVVTVTRKGAKGG